MTPREQIDAERARRQREIWKQIKRAENPLWAPGKFVQYDCTPSAPNNSFCAEIVNQTTEVIARVMRFPSVF